jgi:transcriptional regulator with XRE-family HTH domain
MSGNFGALLRFHRGRHQWSQEALAARCGLSVRAIRDLEADRVSRPRSSTVALMAVALDLRPGERALFEAAVGSSDPVEPDHVPRTAAGKPTLLPPYPRDFCGRAEALAAIDRSTELASLAQLCDRLPLALRVRPHWPVAMMVDRLRDEHHRLDEFGSHGKGVRAAFLASYDALAARERRTYRLLGSLDLPAVDQEAVAALVDLPVPEAGASLTELVEASLVEADTGKRSRPVAYRMHDLLRLFARERCAVEDDPREAGAARDRALGTWATAAAEQEPTFWRRQPTLFSR